MVSIRRNHEKNTDFVAKSADQGYEERKYVPVLPRAEHEGSLNPVDFSAFCFYIL